MKAKIKPITQRLKNRVHEHGEVMIVKKIDYFLGEPALLVESSARNDRNECEWCGWVTEREASWELLE